MSRILIIDDSLDDAEFYTRSLKKQGDFQFTHANTGFEGLKSIQQNNPACVILDHLLPDTSGIRLLSEITSNYPFLPIIFVTGEGNEMLAAESIKNGAEDYLVKSGLQAETLYRSVTGSMRQKALEKDLADKSDALSQQQRALESSYAFQDMIIESLPDYVYIKDEQSRVIKANRAFLALFSCEDNVIGKDISDLFPDDGDKFREQDQQAFEQGYSDTHMSILLPDGRFKRLFTKKNRFVNAQGKQYLLCVSQDITEREQLIEKLTKSNADLEQFAYAASHDLKSPLNSIIKLITWMEQDNKDILPDAAKEHFVLIKGRAERMSHLLKDLLDYARVDARLKDEENVDLSTVCHQAFNLLGNTDGFVLQAADVEVWLPRIGFNIVAINLLNNAIKHHHKASGKIVVSICPVKGGYQLDFEDDGPGIPAKYVGKAFQMFQKLESRDEVEGSGIGLAMVKKIVEHYGGNINVDSDFQPGCRIRIFWPSRDNYCRKKSIR